MDNKIRQLFPILQNKINNKPLIYLDNAATTQKPRSVVEAIEHFYFNDNANIHRGIYKLSQRATNAYEKSRKNIAEFINAKYTHEIIFVRNTTEAINLVAQSYGYKNFKPGDEIIISTMEHHSNIVPWQLICKKTGAKLQVINIHENGELDFNHYEKLINNRTKIVAIAHASNTLGTVNPIKKIIAAAHAHNIPVLIDGAQASGHIQIDVQNLDCDFYAFSAHKMYGPTGIGILYGKEALLNSMPPYQGGGDMIKKVTFAETEYADLPQKFEAGTPNIADVVGFGATIDFIKSVGIDVIAKHEKELLKYATAAFSNVKGLKIIGTAPEKTSIISFILDKIHPHDVATILDTEGIAVRAGHHCTMPLMEFYNIPGTTRASFGLYNTKEEIDILIEALTKVRKIFSR
ncbi:MAG: cysteine sulfinate desulfinase [Gammaproteobacteria bacterium RBG_16_37_9]|nr:MAG: cysteine sulfinate desulfinase [Gammaproteobacteria bacterium RBG_16_37_9]